MDSLQNCTAPDFVTVFCLLLTRLEQSSCESLCCKPSTTISVATFRGYTSKNSHPPPKLLSAHTPKDIVSEQACTAISSIAEHLCSAMRCHGLLCSARGGIELPTHWHACMLISIAPYPHSSDRFPNQQSCDHDPPSDRH